MNYYTFVVVQKRWKHTYECATNSATRRQIRRIHNCAKEITHYFQVPNTIFGNMQLGSLNFPILSPGEQNSHLLQKPRCRFLSSSDPQIELVVLRPSWSRRTQIRTQTLPFVCLFHHTAAWKDIQRKENVFPHFKIWNAVSFPNGKCFKSWIQYLKLFKTKPKLSHSDSGRAFILPPSTTFPLHYFVFSIILNQALRFDLEQKQIFNKMLICAGFILLSSHNSMSSSWKWQLPSCRTKSMRQKTPGCISFSFFYPVATYLAFES